VIFEKVALGRFSFLIAILQYAVFILITNKLGSTLRIELPTEPKLRRAKVRI